MPARLLSSTVGMLALAALGLAALAASRGPTRAAGSAAAERILVLASWNIEHLGGREEAQQSFKAVAQHLRLIDADVLVLQEVYDTDGKSATRTNAILDAAVALLGAQGGTWSHKLLPKRDANDTVQLMGVLWNEERAKLEEAWPIPVKYVGEDVWRRRPYALRFEAVGGGTDFVLIPVHMKAGSDDEEASRAARAEEARTLVAQLEAVRRRYGGDQDVVVLGDTNCAEADEEALAIFAEAGLRDLNARDATTYQKGPYRAPFDRVLVPDQPEFRWSRQYVLTPADPDDHLERLSDHAAVLTTLRVLDDDD